jgi:hypothetical protein
VEDRRIDNISVEHDGGVVVVRLDVRAHVPGDQFAFYIWRNGERVDMQWYSAEPELRFDTEGRPGHYRFTGFLRDADGATETRMSRPVFMNPQALSTSQVRELRAAHGAYLLAGRPWSVPALWYPGPAEARKLWVMLPSAVARDQVVLPAFNRWTWAAEARFPGHVLCLADPTLDLNPGLGLGWCLGSGAADATSVMAAFVVAVADEFEIPPEDVVFYGSSAGGFAALALAAQVDGSTAVAINPQTDVMSYEITRQVDLIRATVFEGLPADEVRAKHPARVDMRHRWQEAGSSRALMVQNVLDPHHHTVHFEPMWTSLGGTPPPGPGSFRAGRHGAILYSDPAGHASEPAAVFEEIVRALAPNGLMDTRVP